MFNGLRSRWVWSPLELKTFCDGRTDGRTDERTRTDLRDPMVLFAEDRKCAFGAKIWVKVSDQRPQQKNSAMRVHLNVEVDYSMFEVPVYWRFPNDFRYTYALVRLPIQEADLLWRKSVSKTSTQWNYSRWNLSRSSNFLCLQYSANVCICVWKEIKLSGCKFEK